MAAFLSRGRWFKCVPRGPLNCKLVSAHVVAWHQTGSKPWWWRTKMAYGDKNKLQWNLNWYRKIFSKTMHSKVSLQMQIWVRSRNCGCCVTWFCYQLITKPGNKTATVSWPDPYSDYISKYGVKVAPTSVFWDINSLWPSNAVWHHICSQNLDIIGLGIGLLPVQHPAIS